MNQLSYLGGPALYLALVCQCPVLFLYLGDEKDQIQHLQTLTNECKKKCAAPNTLRTVFNMDIHGPWS